MTALWAGWWLVRRPGRGVNGVLSAVVALVATLHVGFEGARFHMAPTYLLGSCLAGLSHWAAGFRNRRWRSRLWVRAAVGLPVILFVVVAAALPTVFPVFTYPNPSGPYGIGTAEYELKNAPRGRDLVIQAWYPTGTGTRGARAGITSRPQLLEAAYASFTGLPKPLFQNIRFVRTHAIQNAALVPDQSRFPVVLFSHGPLSANRSQSIFQMEALASRGFIVVAIDHTGYASTTIFPDGHTVPPSSDATWPVFVDARSTAMLNTWVADVRFVIDRLEELNADDPNGLLTGRLDLARIGYVGASFGGSVVVQALLDEPRIKAGIAQDGKPYFSDQTLTDLHRPLMYMQSAAPYMKSSDAQLARWGLTAALFKTAEQDHYARQMQLFSRANAPIYNVYIRRTNHVTFSDLYLIIGVPDPALMDIRRAHTIINDYTVAFFDQVLERRAGALGRRPDAVAVRGGNRGVAQCGSPNRECALKQVYRVADGHPCWRDDGRVEAEGAFEPAHDVAQDLRVLRHRIGIEGGHDAASAQIVECDDRISDLQTSPFPLALLEPRHAGDDQVRSKPSCIAAESLKRSIGRNQQREDVESEFVVTPELRPVTDRRLND